MSPVMVNYSDFHFIFLKNVYIKLMISMGKQKSTILALESLSIPDFNSTWTQQGDGLLSQCQLETTEQVDNRRDVFNTLSSVNRKTLLCKTFDGVHFVHPCETWGWLDPSVKCS